LLVVDMNASNARFAELPHRPHRAQRIAPARAGICDQWHIDRIRDRRIDPRLLCDPIVEWRAVFADPSAARTECELVQTHQFSRTWAE
jgi:hypothetical protein